MYADFTEDGALIVYAEDNTEAYALNEWSKKYMANEPNDRPVFGTDSRKYLDKSIKDDSCITR